MLADFTKFGFSFNYHKIFYKHVLIMFSSDLMVILLKIKLIKYYNIIKVLLKLVVWQHITVNLCILLCILFMWFNYSFYCSLPKLAYNDMPSTVSHSALLIISKTLGTSSIRVVTKLFSYNMNQSLQLPQTIETQTPYN